MFIDKDLYEKILDSIPVITCDIVIFNKEKSKVLLFKRNNNPLKGVYYTPGGRVNKNEPLNNAVIRKAKQELGLELNSFDLKYCGILEEFFDNSSFGKSSSHHINVVYQYILNDINEINLDNQHEEFDWFDINDLSLHFYLKKKINLCKLK